MDNSQYIFVTEVGSRMWGMENFASDYDLFNVFQQPSSEYLRTSNFEKTRPAKTYFEDGKEIDSQFMEIGHLIHQLKKGNVNALWAVCSGVVWKDSETLQKLRRIVVANLSKESYYSIKGMAISGLNDAIKRAAVRDPAKSLWTCARTLNFGCNLLCDKGICFEVPEVDSVDESYCKLEFDRLDECYKISNLPEKVDPKPFEDFLYRLRKDEIIKDILNRNNQ
jgi:predicted nucleotidyltransferase